MTKSQRTSPRTSDVSRTGLPAGASIIALEKRIAFDGAAAATAAKVAHHVGDPLASDRHATPADAAAADHQGFPRANDGPTAVRTSVERSSQKAAETARSVVFIESNVPDVATLIKDIDHSATIVMLDAAQDGVDAIASFLQSHAGYKNVYIFSHGSEANLSLGTADLDAESMQGRYAADLATIKNSLAPNANILVYGCDFAENADGDSAAHLLATLTGASVAASTDATGGTAEGGDFILEDRIGTLDAPDILAPTIASDYDGLLASPTTTFATSGSGAYKGNLEFLTFANTSLASGGIKNGATATYKTADGSTITVTFSNVSNATDAATFKPAALDAYSPSNFYSGYDTSSSSVMLYGGYNDTASFTITFTATDKNGKSFTPNIAFADGEVTDASGEQYVVKTNGGAFQNIETIGSNSYNLQGVGTQTVTLSNTVDGVPLLVTDNATKLNVTVQIAGGKEGFVLALVDPTLSLDSDGSSGAASNNYQTTFTEKGQAVAIADTDTSVAEPGGSAAGATVVLTNAQAGDVLGFSQSLPSGISSTIDTTTPGQITLTLSGNASLATYQTAIEDITFANTSSDPSTIDRTIDVTYSDGGRSSNTAVSTIHVTAVNDAPVETVPGAQSTNKDTALSISGLSVSDVDADGGNETVTLSVANGTISLATTTGLSFSSGTGTNDTIETFTGTLDAINNAIATIQYQPTTGFHGSDTLAFSTNDDGNTGTGGAKTAAASVAITVANVNPSTNGTISNRSYADGQSRVSVATSQAFSDSLGLTLNYTASGLPTGLSINAATGVISGTIDHDASKNAPRTTGSGATLDGTYTVVVTASDGQGGTATQSFTIDAKNTAPKVGTATANQTSNDGATIATVDASKAFSDPNGDPLTYAATNLPSGLSINSATGKITGTVAGNAAPGTYQTTVTATDDKGASTTESFTWTVKDVPPTATGTLANETYADATSGISIATAGGFGSPNNLPLIYSASGLPAGLSIDQTTGLITGQLDHDASKNAPRTTGSGATLDGTYTVTVTASDGQGGTATQSFTIDATNTAPVLVAQTPNQSGADGQTVSVDAAKAFSDANTGDTFTYAVTGLPAGLSINASTGLISGTIDKSASQTGPYSVTVSVTDDKGATANETFQWTVSNVAPVATPPLSDRTAADGSAVTIQTANGFTNPNNLSYTYSANGLPTGLSLNAATGVISGTLDHDASIEATNGIYTISVTANDGQGGSATNTFHLTATNQAPIVGTQTANQANTDGATITAVNAAAAFSDPNGDPLTYAASNLPKGLTIDPNSGIITGTIAGTAAPGSYGVTVTARDDKGLSTPETFTWVVTDVPPTANGTIQARSYDDSTPGITISTSGAFTSPNGLTLTYAATGLPAGLSIDPTTGLISGTLDHDASKNAPATSGTGATLDGTYTIVVIASDGQGGTATQSFTIDAKNDAPVVGTKTANQTSTQGDTTSVSTASAFSDPNAGDVLTYTASSLPAGLSINAATGLITGTVGSQALGAYNVAVTVTDDKGAATTETFTWTVDIAIPGIASPIPNSAGYDGNAVSLDTASHFTNNPTAYSASGLPQGLTIDPTTGTISGTLDHDASENAAQHTGSGATLDGSYTVTVTATNGAGSAQQTFTFDALNQAPVVAQQTANQTSTTGQTISPVDAGTYDPQSKAGAFSDPNGDPLTYAANGLPSGLAIDPNSGTISGTLTNTVPGSYAVTVTATDDKGAKTSESFTWTVADLPPTANGTIADRTFADATSGISIATGGAFLSPNGLTLTYSASGLPAGLSIDPTSGIITGQISHDASAQAQTHTGSGASLDGSYAVVVLASDGQGGTATQTFVIHAQNSAPTVVSATPDQSAADGQTVSLDTAPAFADPNTGDVLTYGASNLPTGLSIDPVTGRISGTIATTASTNAPYAVAITATDDKGAAVRETFTFAVADVAPVATPPLADRAAYDGAPLTYATAGGFTNPNGLALSYSATGLPAGLTINPSTGLIAGTLDQEASAAVSGGKYTIAVTVNDGQGGTATNTFHLTASNQAPVVGTVTPDQSSRQGQSVTSIDTASVFTDPNGDTLTYAASNLPKGLTIDSTGRISGTVATDATPGSYLVTVTATDDKGAATPETFIWAVDDVPPTTVGSFAAQTFADGVSGIGISTAGGFASSNGAVLTYSATGLPPGLAIDPATGTISGSILHDDSANAPSVTGSGATLAGTYTVSVVAKDGQGGAATQTFTITTTNQAPTLVANTGAQSNTDGDTLSLNIAPAFADPNAGDIVTYAATGLPQGLSIDPNTGIISGTVSSTASASGPYAVRVTATDDKQAATVESFAWTIADLPPSATTPIAVPAIADGSAITPIASAGHFADPNGLPLTYSATGLPPGLSIDPVTGIISGTMSHDASAQAPVTTGSNGLLDGAYDVVVTASDGQGGSASQTFSIHATNEAPAVVAATPDQYSADRDTVTLGISSAFADPNAGDVLTYAASGLPQGLSIDPQTGVIGGTLDATASAHGPYTVTVTATDDKGAATNETFAWNVADVPPTASGTVAAHEAVDGTPIAPLGTAGYFASPNGLPLTYSASGLPAGLTIDPATGVISGTMDHDASANAPVKTGSGATLDGTYTVTITASDGQGGSATQAFTLDATNQAPVVSSPTANQHGVDSGNVSLDVSQAFTDPNTGDVLTYTASGLPAGLSIDGKTGVISGTIDPTASAHGPYAVVVTATDDKGAAVSESFGWSVDDLAPTPSGTMPALSAADGTPIAPLDTAGFFANPNGLPLTYTASGLPAGLTIDPATGVISGTVDHDAAAAAPIITGAGATLDGSYHVTITASDGQGGSATQAFTFDATNQAPSIAQSLADQHSADGAAISLAAGNSFIDPNVGDVLTFSASGLPKGLGIDPQTGLITGTIDARASADGPYAVTVTAVDDKGAATVEHFAWTVDDLPPSAADAIAGARAVDDTAIAPLDTASHFGNPNGLPLTYSATGLPPGLVIDPATGVISGTLAATASHGAPATQETGQALDGTYSVVVIASDGQGGSASQHFTFDALSAPPIVATTTPDQRSVGGQVVALDASSAFGAPQGDTLRYSATSLPPGLAIDPATGRISGTLPNTLPANVSYDVVVTATDLHGASVSESFNWTVTTVAPSNIAQIAPYALLPVALQADGTRDVEPVPLAAASLDAKGAVLAAIHDISGLPDQTIAVRATGIVLATVNGITPLDGLRDLATTDIVRSATTPGVRATRTDDVLPLTDSVADIVDVATYGASLRDTDPLTGNEGATINVETVVRDRFLVLKVDNQSPLACVVPVARYTITLPNDRSLPDWLRSDANGVVAGKVPSNVETIELKVRAELANGIVSEQLVTVHVGTGAIRSQGRVTEDRSGRAPRDLIEILRHGEAGRSIRPH